jgi:hypothetical protein
MGAWVCPSMPNQFGRMNLSSVLVEVGWDANSFSMMDQRFSYTRARSRLKSSNSSPAWARQHLSRHIVLLIDHGTVIPETGNAFIQHHQ